MSKRTSPMGIFIWLLAILFFFYEFFLRVLPATLAGYIIQDLNITAEQFALIGSAYYITYAIMQIPVGMLVDRFGVRILLTMACAFCALGVFWFGYSHSFFLACVSRLLIGFGSSFAFVSLLILAINWFNQKYFGFLTGLAQFLGAIGPLIAGAPVALVIQMIHGDWRELFFWIGIFGFILSFVIGIFVKGKPPRSKQKIIFLNKSESLSLRIIELLKNTQIWWIILYAGMIYVCMPLLGAFWGTTYMETRGFDKSSAALIVSMIWLGLAFASPTFGRLSDRSKRRKPFMVSLGILGLIISCIILYYPIQNLWILCFLFFLLGVSSAGQSLSFATISENVPSKLHATALGINNTSIMLFGAIIPPFATSIIQNAAINDPQITDYHFTKGLTVLPFLYGIASIIAFFCIHETFCRSRQNVVILKPQK